MVLIEAKQDIPQAGAAIVRNINKYQGFGPEIGIECFRPIGHARLDFAIGCSRSVLFGRRDRVFDAEGVSRFGFLQLGKVETLPILKMHVGLQWNK